MAFPISLPENYKIVMVAPTAAANAVAYDTISCRGVEKVWFIMTHVGSSNTDLTLTLNESTDVADSGATTVTATFPNWVDTTASGTTADTLVKGTDAATLVVDADASASQLVVLEWDPAKFSDGCDCIKLVDSGGHGSNTVTVVAVLATAYKQATPPSQIID